MIKQLTVLSQGNPGALNFLMTLLSPQGIEYSIPIVNKIERTGIKGTNLYVMYSDLCNKDLSLVQKLCMNCPDDILINACSRQDYSGRELVKEYLLDG